MLMASSVLFVRVRNPALMCLPGMGLVTSSSLITSGGLGAPQATRVVASKMMKDASSAAHENRQIVDKVFAQRAVPLNSAWNPPSGSMSKYGGRVVDRVIIVVASLLLEKDPQPAGQFPDLFECAGKSKVAIAKMVDVLAQDLR